MQNALSRIEKVTSSFEFVGRGRFRRWLGAACAGLAFMAAAGQALAAEPCNAPGAGQPMLVTADCEDPIYNESNFVVESTTEMATPLPHTRVIGHFRSSTSTPQFTVTMYFPKEDAWQGRFFQHAYPLEQPENFKDIEFALSNGGYLVNVKGVPCGCGGYRPDAGAAKLAMAFARRQYRPRDKIRGYLWGGSGGGLLTTGAVENTSGVWDGVVPFVLPNGGSLLNANSIGALSGMILRSKFAEISDSLKPGGSGKPFDGLSPEQTSIFKEALAMGLPLQTFEMPSFSGGILLFLSGGVRSEDPGYVKDFWSEPGYEGANPPAYLSAAKVDDTVTVASIERDAKGNPTSLTLDREPKLGSIGALGLELAVLPADPAGSEVPLGGELKGAKIVLRAGAPSAAKAALREGSQIRASNLFYLALNYYHRHTLPPERDMYTYDQFRNADGMPKFVQRSYLGSSVQALSPAGGGTQSGKIRAKVIINQSMLDGGAMPWMADWYAKRVKRALGPKGFADNFRLFINDNAGHLDIDPAGPLVASTISYVPSLYQSLLDLVNWIERGVPAPASTRYAVRNGQVILPATAEARRGIQPVVKVVANGSKRIEVGVGQPVTFTGSVSVPTGTGKVTSTAWWFGEGMPSLVPVNFDGTKGSITVAATHSYSKPGTYFVTFKATAQRDGRPGDKFTSIQNLDRLRVVVK